MRLAGHIARMREMTNTSIRSLNLKGKHHSEDLSVEWRVLLEWILRETGWKIVDWIQLAKDSEQGRTPVNTTMNLRVQ
jgi:hypothetical protein